MLGESRGFTVVQFIVAMTVGVLLLLAVFVAVARKGQRDDQRKADLVTVSAMVERYAESRQGRYPDASEAGNPGSGLEQAFEGLRLTDPGTGKYYGFGSDFGDCDPTADSAHLGPGYISYGRPGTSGPYKLRVCMEHGEYYFAN